ncbi:MAG: VOC family protein [Gammaproteobacteria bacterium]|nr:VOC family protein [Gammaproteobacteria bacterium]
MPSGISIVTLGVQNLERSVRFYTEGLGLSLSSHSNRDIAFFELPGSWLALYSHAALAADAGVPAGEPGGFTGITLAHNVADRQAVDEVLQTAVAAGAEIVKPAQDVFWGGYSGYFKDPDGYLWEVAWNPGLPLRQ